LDQLQFGANWAIILSENHGQANVDKSQDTFDGYQLMPEHSMLEHIDERARLNQQPTSLTQQTRKASE